MTKFGMMMISGASLLVVAMEIYVCQPDDFEDQASSRAAMTASVPATCENLSMPAQRSCQADSQKLASRP